jgi:hypothetical protein
MSYQEIVNLGFRRKNARLILDSFIRQRLIEEDCQDWLPGKKLWYRLTSKGKKYLADVAMADIADALGMLRYLGPPYTTRILHFYAVGSGANIAIAGYRTRKKTKERRVR